jgi:hypothetical protein
LNGRTVDELVPKPLVIPLTVIVLHELPQESPKMPLTHGHDPIEAFLFDRPHEAQSVLFGPSKRNAWSG